MFRLMKIMKILTNNFLAFTYFVKNILIHRIYIQIKIFYSRMVLQLVELVVLILRY